MTSILAEIRREMKQQNIDAYIVPSADEHQNEMPDLCDRRREALTGFTGSAGTAVVMQEKACLWIDGRYFLQADKEVDAETWTCMRAGEKDTPGMTEFLLAEVSAHGIVGVDPAQVRSLSAHEMQTKLDTKGIKLVAVEDNFVDRYWKDRPERRINPIEHHPIELSGQSCAQKINVLREKMQNENIDAFLVSELDEVAWIFNLRGRDFAYTPLFTSYALVTKDCSWLYCYEEYLPDSARKMLEGVTVMPYSLFYADMKSKDWSQATIGISECCSWKTRLSFGCNVTAMASPVARLKAVKNKVELAAIQECHLEDGIAMVRFYCWLGNMLGQGQQISESQAAAKLDNIRLELGCVDLSFETISSYGKNSAYVHGRPGDTIIGKDTLYLCDSGGQYKKGTTDVTRTVCFGEAGQEERNLFTRVLRGNIELERAVFPAGTTGGALDVLARRFLWEVGCDYRHGTGHGVGAYLCVHEGPQSISCGGQAFKIPLEEGMVVSNEPGVYLEGKYGIRIENLLWVEKASTSGYLCFKCLTLAPVQTSLVNPQLLGQENIRHLHNYNDRVLASLKAFLSSEELAWLQRHTRKI